MTPDFEARCKELIARGESLGERVPRNNQYGHNYWFKREDVPDVQAWIASVANLFRISATPDTYFAQEGQRVLEHKDLAAGVPHHTLQKLLGLLYSLLEEAEAGLLKKAEYAFAASTFDDFIDHAAEYHRGNRKIEAAVLVSAVFEDAIRKIADKFMIVQRGEQLDSVIDNLGKKGHITPVKVKRYKGFAALRNNALHAQWDNFDIKDVGAAIAGTRELIEDFL